MDKKKITSFRNRIKKAQSSFGAMTEVMLKMDLQSIELNDLIILQNALATSRSPLSYTYLNDLIIKKQNN